MPHRLINFPLVALALLAAAPLAAAPLAAQTAPSRSEFVIRKGKDTLAVERFTRDGATLSGDIAQSNGIRTEYVYNLRRDGRVEHAEVSRKMRQGSALL